MIDACQIYKQIKAYASLDDNVFCDLHKCTDPDKCNHPQHHCMLNFDEVKNTYCRETKIDPCKSADGLSYNRHGILFIIEIKGWKLYEKYSNPKSEQEVKEKVRKYELSVKLSDSLKICANVLTKTGTITVPMVYLVVSDIKKDEGVESIESNLALLAETSSDFSTIYGEEIKSQLLNISDIDFGFVENCQQIDKEISSWTKARKVQLL